MKQSIYTLIAILFCVQLLTANEIIPIWNRSIEAPVQDMEFLKGQEEVIMLVGEGPNGFIQKRNSHTGDLISSRSQSLSSISRLALTPDSTKFLFLSGSIIRLVDTDEGFSVLNHFYIPQESDSILLYFTSLAVDPIRPIVYLTTRGWIKDSFQYADKYKVTSYNYETGEKVKDYTQYGGEEYSVIKTSHDGKYLAAMNDGDTYLRIWDIELGERVVNMPLFDYSSERRCEPEDIYFPKNHDNLIYYSGFFSKKVHINQLGTGVYKLKINNLNKTFVLPEETYGGWNMVFFDNENRVLSNTSGRIGIINLFLNELEWYGIPPDNIYSTTVIYSGIFDFFLGAAGSSNISKFKYDRETSVELKEETNSFTISPNPAESYIEINDIISTSDAVYTINSMTGEELMKFNANEINNINIDMLSSGTYFITKKTGNMTETQKFIKR
jgi:WD40 repeat protein